MGSSSSANSEEQAQDKRVLPGSLVRQIDKTNAQNLWRLVLKSVQQKEKTPQERRTEENLENLIKELTRIVMPTDHMRRLLLSSERMGGQFEKERQRREAEKEEEEKKEEKKEEEE